MVTFSINYKLCTNFVLAFYRVTSTSCLLYLNGCVCPRTRNFWLNEDSTSNAFWAHMEFRTFSDFGRHRINVGSWYISKCFIC
jgi:hypothetical protein